MLARAANLLYLVLVCARVYEWWSVAKALGCLLLCNMEWGSDDED